MAREAAGVTGTEMAILDVLWRNGASTVREIVQAVYGEHRQSLHSAVKSLLQRLTEKELVTCQRRGFAHLFVATVDRDTFVGEELQRLADNHYGGALAPMLLTLTQKASLSRKDREVIRKIIENIHE